MLNISARLMLTSSAFMPLMLVLSAMEFFKTNFMLGLSLLIASVILVLLCCYLLKITAAEIADKENISFVLFYFLPLLTNSFAEINLILWLLVIVILVLIYSCGYHYHFNPLFNVLGWHFYKTHTKEGITYILLTKKQITNNQETYRVKQLTEYIFIDF